MNKKTKWIVTALILVVAIGLGVYNLMRKPVPDGNAAPPRSSRGDNTLSVNALIVKPHRLTDGIFSTATLLPDEEVDLSFETSGKIVEINFSEGTVVKQGQLLAKVNDKPLQAQLSKYLAQLKLAEDRVYRQSALLEKDAVSQEAYEQATTELATLKADIDLVKANIALTELRAPFDGMIGLRQVSEGAYASPSVVVAKLTRISPLKIQFQVPERYAGAIRKGMKIRFTVEGFLDPFGATVYAVGSRVDEDTRSVDARALYANADGKLVPGRYASANIPMVDIADAIAIPTEAVVPELGISKVFLYKGGKAQPVEIRTGEIRTDAEVQVVSGLAPGDTLITSGTLQLRTGLNVKLDKIE